MSLISFKENDISQRPALELLQALGSLIQLITEKKYIQ